jgi:hypothetical protein
VQNTAPSRHAGGNIGWPPPKPPHECSRQPEPVQAPSTSLRDPKATKLRIGRVCRGGIGGRGVEAVGAEAGAGEESQPCPFAELGEHVAWFDVEKDGQVVTAPVARVAGDDGGGPLPAGGRARRTGRAAVIAGSAGPQIQGRGADGDVDRGDGGGVGRAVLAVQLPADFICPVSHPIAASALNTCPASSRPSHPAAAICACDSVRPPGGRSGLQRSLTTVRPRHAPSRGIRYPASRAPRTIRSGPPPTSHALVRKYAAPAHELADHRVTTERTPDQ